MRRGKHGYFERIAGAPPPVWVEVRRRICFGEVDAMAVLWHGQYARLFEEASTELRRRVGLGYETFRQAGLRAPVVEFHADYHRSLFLDELATVRATLIWTDAARLNIEYEVRGEAGHIAATGCSVQLFVESPSGEVCYVCPPLLDQCRTRWKRGEFSNLP
jgi:acyl-CoA thioester hydrolase